MIALNSVLNTRISPPLSVSRNGKKRDIFSILFKQWSDPEYLFNFFVQHQTELDTWFKGDIEVDDAVQLVLEDAYDFETEIMSIQQKLPGFKNKTISELFKELHKGVYLLKAGKKDQKKSKPYTDSMLRLYAVNLDYALVVTGGGIKIVNEMRGSYLEPELNNLDRVQSYLRNEGIVTPQGFDE